jgi:polar amino acid transport system substrate-binding protein
MRHLRLASAAIVGATIFSTLVPFTNVAHAAMTPSACANLTSNEFSKGKLTVATDNPVYSPWFINNKPSSGKGYESAVVYALAKVMGVASKNVRWVTENFDASYTPGSKSFDFDINEISYSADRAKAVTFSKSYYDVQQSIIALKTNAIVKKHSAADLKNYLYGDQIGTTGLTYINTQIKPTKTPRVYSTLNDAVAALQSGQIDALVIDTPTGEYMASAQIMNSKKKLTATQVGQFPSVGEHYGLLFQKGSKLTGCVNAAIDTLRTNGTLSSLAKKWLGLYTSVPVLKP